MSEEKDQKEPAQSGAGEPAGVFSRLRIIIGRRESQQPKAYNAR